MKIALVSDTHNLFSKLQIPQTDLLIHAGDFTTSGGEYEINGFLQCLVRLKQQQPKLEVVVIPGNHDDNIYKYQEQWQQRFRDSGASLLIDNSHYFMGYHIYGAPYGPWPPHWPFSIQDVEPPILASQYWDRIPTNVDILITHHPPYMYGDKVLRPRRDEDPNVGSKSLRETIPQLPQLKLHVFGHIHEGRGTYIDSNVTFVNAASVDFSHTKHFDPIELEL